MSARPFNALVLRIFVFVGLLSCVVPRAVAQRSYIQSRQPIMTSEQLSGFLVELDQDIGAVIEALYDDFTERHDRAWMSIAASIEALGAPRASDNEAIAQHAVAVRKLIEEWNGQRRQLFNSFVNDVGALIDSTAFGAWSQAAQLARQSDWMSELDPSHNNLDLADPFSYLDAQALNAAEQRQIEELREQYFDAMGAALGRLDSEFDSLSTRLTEATLLDAPATDHLRQRYREMVDGVTAINTIFRERIASVLAPENREIFRHERDRDAVPQLYRDAPMDFALAEVREMNLSADGASRIEMAYERYLRRRDSLRRQILHACYEWTSAENRAKQDAEMERLGAEHEAGMPVTPLDAKRAHPALPLLYDLLELEKDACRQVEAILARENVTGNSPVLDFILHWYEPLPDE